MTDRKGKLRMSSETPPPRTSQPEDEAAVRRSLYTQLMDGWNRGSAEAFSAPFAEDGHLVAFDGTHFKGRDEIVSFHQPLFDKWLRGTRLVGEVESVRFLSPMLPSCMREEGRSCEGNHDLPRSGTRSRR
jgi:uncharacterized protein (TIGR02246 family)